MRYRVQYLAENERRTAQVEASSPQEAVVKFCHIQQQHHHVEEGSSEVLSVSPEPEFDELAW